MFQAHLPDLREKSRPHPGLEPQMARAAGTVLVRDHLPLAAGAQDVKDTVEDGTVRHSWSTIGPGLLVGRQDGFGQAP